jgi:hypothetical protein
MTPTTKIAAIDATNCTGAVYGVGISARGALQSARISGQVEPDVTPRFAYVAITDKAAAFVRAHGGAPNRSLRVWVQRAIVYMASEADTIEVL